MLTVMFRWLIFAMTCLVSGPAYAYIGPGAGISAIGAVLALIGAMALAVVGFVWYPLKRLRRNRQRARTQAAEGEEGPPS